MTKLFRALLPGTIVTAVAFCVWLLFLVGSFFVSITLKLGDVRPPQHVPYIESAVIYFFVAVVAGLAGFAWFIPTSIAAMRECRNSWGILVLNLIPGLGHLIALIWALVEQPPQTIVVHHFQPTQTQHE